MIITLFKFAAVIAFFDSISMTFVATIKGAGDTKFAMKLVALIFIAAAIPMYLISDRSGGLYQCWSILVIYGIILSASFYIRYRMGKWKRMRVIEMNVIDD